MNGQGTARTCPGGQMAYTIQARDTFFTLSRRFNVSLQSIIDANPGATPTNLRIGQVICIPGVNSGPPVCPAGSFSYTIAAGDTLYGLSRRFGVTQQSILALNPGIDANSLRVAQIICIPGQAPSACTCEQNLTAANRNIAMLKEESEAQILADMNYGNSTATTIATTVTPAEIRFDAAEVSFPGNFTCQFIQGTAYAFFMDSAAGGQRGLVVRDNFGIWHTFAYSVPVA